VSYRDLIADSVALAFGQLGDLVVEVTYTGKGGYDPATGSVSEGASQTIKGVFASYSRQEVDGSTVQVSDRKLVVRATTPLSIGGNISYDGMTYEIISVTPDPADTTYTVQLRR